MNLKQQLEITIQMLQLYPDLQDVLDMVAEFYLYECRNDNKELN